MRKRALKLHASDNCVVALNDIACGDIVWWDDGEMVASNGTTLGHKLACEVVKHGDSIVKYGAVIGHATRDIAIGEYVHSHNLTSNVIAIFHHDDAGYQSEEKT
ncbi:UxaA family hydrolase [Escherichia albertii]|uniref:UxaA family hydrolase n=1 Tax=Escherichia albertii TaxID=208962 RepID=UPI0037B401D8